jgi:hypothetical protein
LGPVAAERRGDPTMIPNLIRRFVIMAVAVPLAAAGARKLSDAVEARRGPSRGTRLLRRGADTLQVRFGRQKKRSRFAFGR